MTINEVRDIYSEVKNTCNNLTIKYFEAIATVVVADLVIPVVTYALFEATAGTAIKLLQKIPVSMVLKGYRLNKMVKQVAQLGIQGNQVYVRELHGMTVSKADELFKVLTKDAISITEITPNVIKANMGSGNFITFRTISNSPNVIATIDLNFYQLLGTNSFKLKFYP